MEDNGAKIVSDAILGEDLKYVTIGGVVYSIKPPSIEIILRAIRHFSRVQLAGTNYTKVDILSEYPRNTEHLTRGIAVLITGRDDRKTKRVAKKLKKGTYDELLVAFQKAVLMMGGDSFFALASSVKSVTKMAANPK